MPKFNMKICSVYINNIKNQWDQIFALFIHKFDDIFQCKDDNILLYWMFMCLSCILTLIPYHFMMYFVYVLIKIWLWYIRQLVVIVSYNYNVTYSEFQIMQWGIYHLVNCICRIYNYLSVMIWYNYSTSYWIIIKQQTNTQQLFNNYSIDVEFQVSSMFALYNK